MGPLGRNPLGGARQSPMLGGLPSAGLTAQTRRLLFYTGYLSTGSSFTVPEGSTYCEAVSVGGGAGGASAPGNSAAGADGGSGAVARSGFAVKAGDTISYSLGVAGSAGPAGSFGTVGTAGTATTVTYKSTVVAKADGGYPGSGANTANEGAGGLASNSIGNLAILAGQPGTVALGGGSAPYTPYGPSDPHSVGGATASGKSASGNAGSGYGAGGSGGSASPSNQYSYDGGPGTAGAVALIFYADS